VTAARAIFLNDLSQPSVVTGVLIMAVLALVASALAARSFGRAVA
jgi:hypothetical protein